MNDNNLYKIAVSLSKPPKGILAADESTNTITKRFLVPLAQRVCDTIHGRILGRK